MLITSLSSPYTQHLFTDMNQLTSFKFTVNLWNSHLINKKNEVYENTKQLVNNFIFIGYKENKIIALKFSQRHTSVVSFTRHFV